MTKYTDQENTQTIPAPAPKGQVNKDDLYEQIRNRQLCLQSALYHKHFRLAEEFGFEAYVLQRTFDGELE